jgi:ABC-type uncharacterized transport system substrate-binding protein
MAGPAMSAPARSALPSTPARALRSARLLVAAAGLLAAGLVPSVAAAHPHVFVEYGIVVLMGPRGVEGVQLAYAFDPLFTSMILQTFDTDGDGTFSRKEMQVIESKHFANIRTYDYFVTLRAGDRALPITARDFHVRLPRDQATYVFTVPVAGLDPAGGTLEIVVDDPTFYTAFLLRERSPVEVKAVSSYRVNCTVARDRTGLTPDAARCEYRRVER